MKKYVKDLVKYATIIVLLLTTNSYALTVNNYNKFCEDGKLMNVEIKFNDVVAKYNKYGHYQLGDDLMPTGDLSDPLSNEGDRDMAHIAVQSDTTFKIYGELDEEEMDYSFYDLEDVSASELKVYELNAKLEALHVGNQVQERSGFGKYNLRNGKNLIAFIKFAYEFYKNSSGEYRVGVKDDKLFKDTPAEGKPVCPMELLEEYAGLNSTSAVELNNGFEDKFKDCVSKWEYIGNKNLENSDRIFETLEDIYMGLVYLYPALKVLQNEAGMNLDDLDDDDRAAIFSMAYEVKGMQPITSANVSDEHLTRKFSRIGAGDLIGALIEDEELNFSVAETVYRYMIEIKHKNNPQNLARWVAEYEDIFGTYEPLDADSYDRFMKAYNVAFAKYGFDVSRQTGLDYVFFGYVEHPELFESKESLEEATRKFANHLRTFFADSAFIRNKDNANYVAKSYMMAQKMCENTGFLDITDIYASDICLVEHSYGYNSTEYILSDTQVVSLEGKLEEGDFDTDKDEVLDRDEIGIEEEVNISKLLEAYIDYNELPQEEADKLRAIPTVKMYNYISNPVLPDSDFDGRDDRRDRARALDNSYTFDMDTLNNEQIHFDFNMDYRYFFMDSTKYYPELSDMSLALSNMIGKHKGLNDKKFRNRNGKEPYEERGISNYLWYIGQEDVEERNTGVVPYAISHREVFLRRGKVNHKLRNIITIVIGEDERYKGMLSANIDGSYNSDGDYEEYHHVGFDIEANKIVEDIEEYIDNQYGTKVFWITGFGSGGSIANLVGQKLTKKKGVSNVYCYTFESFATINANNIEDVNSFDYRRYTNIFNIENDDDLMIKFLDRDIGWYKYGRSVRGSAAQLNTKISSILGDNYVGHSGKKQYMGNPNVVKEVLNNILDIVKRIFNNVANTISGLVSGFTDTGPTTYENQGPGSPVIPNLDNNININPQDIKEAKESQHQVIIGQGVGSSYANIPSSAVIATKDANMAEIGQLTNNDKGLYVEDQVAKPVKAGEGKNLNDGIPFIDSYKMGIISIANIDYDYQKDKVSNDDWCIKLDKFKYSNYTIPYGKYDTYDISYSQFWSTRSEILKDEGFDYGLTKDYSHYFLYNNDAGDFGKTTTDMLFGRYHVNDNTIGRTEKVEENGGTFEKNLFSKYGYRCDVISLDGRILTAAPLHLLIKTVATGKSGEDEIIKDLYHNQMHVYSNYILDAQGHKSFKNTGPVNAVASENKIFKYMDVVVESSEGYQYVIPFIVVDVKWLHNEEGGHYSYLTDNTYGHVEETINDSVNNIHKFVKMNPIEPYLRFGKGTESIDDFEYYNEKISSLSKMYNEDIAGKINNEIKKFLFGPNDKIVSMRLYDKQFNESEPNWWKDMRDRMTEKEVADFSKDVKAKIIEGIVVNFAKDIIRED